METPYVSIILPIRNEGMYIRACLKQIYNQTGLDFPIEVIVADGMSTDQTREIVEAFQVIHSNLILIDNPAQIVPIGMNRALRIAKGEIIIRVDGHCEIAPDYIKNCVNHLLNDGVDGVGGPMQTVGETPLSRTIAVAMSSKFGVGDSGFRTTNGKTMFVDSVPFPAYTRKIIERVGFYDEELVRNQDDEYNYRILENDGKLLLAADVKSRYYSRGTLVKLWKQYFQYGFWKVRVLQKHPRQMRLRQYIPPLFVFTIIFSLITSLIYPIGQTFLFGVVGCYLIANLIASFLAASKNGWKHLILLPVVFAILHISYGLGFLVGIIKFTHRWNDKAGKVPQIEYGDI